MGGIEQAIAQSIGLAYPGRTRLPGSSPLIALPNPPRRMTTVTFARTPRDDDETIALLEGLTAGGTIEIPLHDETFKTLPGELVPIGDSLTASRLLVRVVGTQVAQDTRLGMLASWHSNIYRIVGIEQFGVETSMQLTPRPDVVPSLDRNILPLTAIQAVLVDDPQEIVKSLNWNERTVARFEITGI